MDIPSPGAFGLSEAWLVLPALETMAGQCVRVASALREQARQEYPDWAAFADWVRDLTDGPGSAGDPTLPRVQGHHLPALDALIPAFRLCLDRIRTLAQRLDLPHPQPCSRHFQKMVDLLHRSSMTLNGLVAELGNSRDGSGLIHYQRSLVGCRKEAMAEHLAAIGDLLASHPAPVAFLRSKDLLDVAMKAILPLEQAGRQLQTAYLNTLP